MSTVKVNLNHIEAVKEFNIIASRYDFEIDALSGRYKLNAKSIMGLFSLDLSKDITIEIHTEDKEAADKFIESISKYIVK